MSLRDSTLHLCNCNGTMPLDAAALARALELAGPLPLHRQLCQKELAAFAGGAAGDVIVACTQEAPLFADAAQEGTMEGMTEGKTPPSLTFVNVRETAGWSSQANAAGPKMAAMLAAAAVPAPEAPFVTLSSEGVIMVYGRDDQAIEAALPRLTVARV